MKDNSLTIKNIKKGLLDFISIARWSLHWVLPNLIPARHSVSRASQEEQDSKENIESRIPASIELRSLSIWGVEIYTSTEIENLYNGISNLEWGAGQSVADSNYVQNWIKNQRTTGLGGMLNIGITAKSGDIKKQIFVRHYLKLPPEVIRLDATIFAITPSLTALVVRFYLDGSSTKSYEKASLADRRTYKKRLKKNFSVLHIRPQQQKIIALSEVRNKQRRLVREWFSQNAPGYFSSLNDEKKFPFMELLTCKEDIFPRPSPDAVSFVYLDDDHHEGSRWRETFADVQESDVWRLETKDLGLAFSTNAFDHRTDGLNILATISQNNQIVETNNRKSISLEQDFFYRCHHQLSGVFAYMALPEYLKEEILKLNNTREEIKISSSKKHKTVERMEKIRLYFDKSISTPITAMELKEKSSTSNFVSQYCPNFLSLNWKQNEARKSIRDQIKNSLLTLSQRLVNEEESSRSHFEQVLNIINIRENLKTQKRMEKIAIAAMAISIISLAAAIIAIPNLNNILQTS